MHTGSNFKWEFLNAAVDGFFEYMLDSVDASIFLWPNMSWMCVWSTAFTIVFGQEYALTFKLFNLPNERRFLLSDENNIFAQ